MNPFLVNHPNQYILSRAESTILNLGSGIESSFQLFYFLFYVFDDVGVVFGELSKLADEHVEEVAKPQDVGVGNVCRPRWAICG